MSEIDWLVLCSTLLFIIIYGVYKNRHHKDIKDYLKGGNKSSWFTVGISVMATQASAITFLSTPGQAYFEGMGFIQFYFGLPLAMIIICVFFLPIYQKLKVYTAYEFLENRFNLKTRILTASLFLIQRGLAAGITIYAPAIILSVILGWNLKIMVIIIGLLVIFYTLIGGTHAVSLTQKQQMFVIFLGMTVAFIYLNESLPEKINFSRALDIAGLNGKLNLIDFSVDPKSRYTIWSGLTGGLFLALSYFGTDQSQVQRYLSGKSLLESQKGLIMNGFLKIPMQFFILLTGVMVFVFFQFEKAPIHFNPKATELITKSESKTDFQKLENENFELHIKKLNFLNREDFFENETQRKDYLLLQKKEKQNRIKAKALIEKALPSVESNDKDYVFIFYILKYLPTGLIGLLIAVILSAAMSSTASELNALATTSLIDFYKRGFPNLSQKHYVNVAKAFVLFWGLIAISFAAVGNLFENLIEYVNIIGSIFYGTVLGVFLTAFFIKYVNGKAVFIGAIISQTIVFSIYNLDIVGYLWLNLIGAILTIIFSILLEFLSSKNGVKAKD